MKPFTIAYISGRDQPEWPWLGDSFLREFYRFGPQFVPKLIIVQATRPMDYVYLEVEGKNSRPKPTIWQGEHRVTKENWWATANARNTAICLCDTEWICFFDDRCVLQPGYLDALEAAMAGNYILAGGYEKRINMTVENGVIRHGGTITGADSRLDYVAKNKITGPFKCPGSWLFGCNFACPTEWLLNINGIPEICDSSGMEDVCNGLLLEHHGYPIKYDSRAFIVEDRTPELSGPTYRREDKGVSPNDKSHALLAMFNTPDAKRATHTPGFDFDIRKVRADALAGKPWPMPPQIEYRDWYDNTKII